MATYSGFLCPSPERADSVNNQSSDLDGFTVDYWPGHESLMSGPLQQAAYVDNLPITEQENVLPGFVLECFLYDYYFRIHILPNLLDLGQVSVDQVRTVEVWNAYLTSQLLSEILETATDGLELTEPEPAPATFAPLESDLYEVRFIGGATVTDVDAEYDFSFPSELPKLFVIGTQVQLWPFPPHWGNPVLERLEWATNVLTHYDGSEQRVAIRSGPRKRIEYSTMVQHADKQRLNALLWGWQGSVFALPVAEDAGKLTASSLVGESILYVDTAYKDYHAGGIAALILHTGIHELVEIDTVLSDRLNLANPLKANWGKGMPIFPARVARMSDRQSLSAHNSAVEELRVQFDLLELGVHTPDSGVNSYRGYPVLQEQPNWREGVTVGFKRKIAVIDSKTSFPVYDDESGRPARTQSYLWTYQGRAEIAGLISWIYDRQGRKNPVWMSTNESDLTLTTPVLSADLSLRVTHVGYTKTLKQDIGRRDICIRLKNGTYFYRRIDGSLELSATEEQLSIDSDLGQDVALKDVLTISFLEFCRLDADAVEIAWRSPNVAEAAFVTRGLNHDV